MSTYTEPALALEFLQFAVNTDYNFEKVTLTASQGALEAGMVLAKVTGTGNYVPYDDDANGATAGVGIAAAILCYPVANSGSTQEITVLARGPATVKKDALKWEASNDDTEKNAAIADLLAIGIVVRAA